MKGIQAQTLSIFASILVLAFSEESYADANLNPTQASRLLVSDITAEPDPNSQDTPQLTAYPEHQLMIVSPTPEALPPSEAKPPLPEGTTPPNPSTPQIIQRPIYTLRDCLDLALRQNSDILIAKKAIEGAEGAVVEARAAFLPQVSTSGVYQEREQGFFTFTPSDPNLRDNAYYVALRVTENIFSGGGNMSKMRIARLTQSNKMLAYQSAIDTVMLNVRLAYYGILLSQANIEVRHQSVDLLSKQLQAEQNRLAAGFESQTGVLRAQVALANETPALLDAKNRQLNGYVLLSQLMNIPYDPSQTEPPFAVTGSLGYDPRSYNLADCLAKADSSRPELKVFGNNVEIAQKQLIVDRSALLPRVDLFAGYDYTSDDTRSDPTSYTDGYVAGISGSWQIFDGFATIGRMKQTRAKMQAAIATRDQTRTQIEADVRQAFNQLDLAASTVESQIRNVVQARESYILSEASYEAGVANQLDVLQSRVDLTTAQTTEFQARYDYLAATATLQRALSSQFQIVNDTLAPTTPATEPIVVPPQNGKQAAPSLSSTPNATNATPAPNTPNSTPSTPTSNEPGDQNTPSFPPASVGLPPLPSGSESTPGLGAVPSPAPAVPIAPMIPPSINPTPTTPSPIAPPPPSSVPSFIAPPGAAPSPFGSSSSMHP